MGFPRDLDEYPTKTLLAELKKRRKARREGRCDYCDRPVSASACKFPERHVLMKEVKEPLLLRFLHFLRRANLQPFALGKHELETIIKEFRDTDRGKATR